MSALMELSQVAFIAIYFVVLAMLCLYGAHRYLLVFLYHRHKRRRPPQRSFREWPRVTVQLPIFNERYVVARLFRAVSRLRYPRDCLEIQVLDDSTDDCREIVSTLAGDLERRGFDVTYIHRKQRWGFKAGALAEGLACASGEYIAIFDADFVPRPAFLKQLLPYFSDARIGMVQARWEFLNCGYSLLTRMQAVFLDAHFLIEHTARNRSGRFFNFNGTAGVWRRDCLVAAGGWAPDTLTEDLDVSYRAQLAGWRFVFIPQVSAPSELPVQITAFKVQQYRWAKGSIQTAAKVLGTVLRSKQSWKVKLEAFFHLTNNCAYLLMVFLALSMFPSMILRYNMGWQETIWLDLPLLLFSTTAVTAFYVSSQRAARRASGIKAWAYVAGVMALGIGLSLNNGKAVLSALLPGRSEFRRTPKHGIEGARGTWDNKSYSVRLDGVVFAELFMAAYCACCIVFALSNQIYVALPFLCLFQCGFSYVFAVSLWQELQRLRQTKPTRDSVLPLPPPEQGIGSGKGAPGGFALTKTET